MKKPTLSTILIYGFLIFYTIVVAYPMLWLVLTSLKDSWSIFKSPWGLPTSFQFINYKNALVKGALNWKILNSVIVDSIALVIILAVSSMTAYVLARFRFPGNKTLYYLFLAGMTIPVFLAIVPLFILLQSIVIPGFGPLINTRTGLIIVYAAYSLSFTIFVLHGFFRTLPNELAEAAVMDGAQPSQVFWKIMLPLAKPGLVTAGIFVFIGLWNEFPLALVLNTNEARKTLPIGIADLTMSQRYQADWGALFAGLTIGIAPTILLYTIFQRQIQAGLTAGAVKG